MAVLGRGFRLFLCVLLFSHVLFAEEYNIFFNDRSFYDSLDKNQIRYTDPETPRLIRRNNCTKLLFNSLIESIQERYRRLVRFSKKTPKKHGYVSVESGGELRGSLPILEEGRFFMSLFR